MKGILTVFWTKLVRSSTHLLNRVHIISYPRYPRYPCQVPVRNPYADAVVTGEAEEAPEVQRDGASELYN